MFFYVRQDCFDTVFLNKFIPIFISQIDNATNKQFAQLFPLT